MTPTSELGRWAVSPLRMLLQPCYFLRSYRIRDFPADLVAGLTTGVILIPQSIAYALIAGLPPEVGLYTAIIAAVVASLWGSSHHLHTGPTNAASLLVLAILAPLVSVSNVSEYVIAAGLLALLVGILRMLLALLRLGFIMNFISDAVMVGFTAGAGVLIMTYQLSGLFGLETEISSEFLSTVRGLARQSAAVHPLSLILGLSTLGLILVLPHLNRKIPSQFLAVLGVSLVIVVFGLERQGVTVIGPMPRGFPPLQMLPLTDLSLIQRLLPGAGAIALLGLIEALTISRSIATESGQYLDNNQEILGQGMANVVAGFLSGYCSSGSFTRSTVNYTAGGRTRMASILSGCVVLAAVLWMGWAIAYLARPVLAGFVIATAISMINFRRAYRIMTTTRSETLIMAVTFFSVFVFPLVYVVGIGITLSLLVYVYKTSRPRVLPMVPTRDFRHLREVTHPHQIQCPQLTILSIEGDLYFGAANHVEHLLRAHLPPADTQNFILLHLQNMVRIDISGVRMLENFVRLMRHNGGDVYFSHVTEIAMRLFRSSGLKKLIGEDHFLDDDAAIGFLFHRILNPKVCIYDCPHRVFQECQNLPKIAIPFQEMLLELDDIPEIPSITIQDLGRRLEAPDPSIDLIDVREQLEWDRGHIPQARHMPYSRFNIHHPTLVMDQEIILVSNTTRRARNVARILHRNGFARIRVTEGGMQAWKESSRITAMSLYQ